MLSIVSYVSYKMYWFGFACFGKTDDNTIDDYEEQMIERFDYEIFIVFTVLAFTLFIVGFCLLIRIKTNFPQLHKGYRCYLWSALFALTFPLLLRGMTDIAFTNWFEWPLDDFKEAVYNDIFSILTDYLPVVC